MFLTSTYLAGLRWEFGTYLLRTPAVDQPQVALHLLWFFYGAPFVASDHSDLALPFALHTYLLLAVRPRAPSSVLVPILSRF